MAKNRVKKFLALEWLMLWIFGFFWAAAMSIPLFITGSFDNKAESLKNFVIMCGPYLAYAVLRSIFLMGKVLVWSYLTSNFFFKDQAERIFADEVFRFLVFGPLWALIIAVPMYFYGYFNGEASHFLVGTFLAGPYIAYLFLRAFGVLLGSLGWAVQVTIRKK